jgi:peptidoglycan/LPS O-acetylase OafA/YrhL
MRPPLPPDLDRLGDQLAAAAERELAARRRRRQLPARLAAIAVAAVIAPAALAPGGLSSADGTPAAHPMLLAATPVWCDPPRGGQFAIPACQPQPPITPGRPRRW